MAQPMKLSFTQDTTETSPAKREAIGAIRITADGRMFRYARAGAEDLPAGAMGMASQGIPGHRFLSAMYSGYGDRILAISMGKVAVAENVYEDGFIQVVEGEGKGIQCRILSNTAAPAHGTVVLTLAEAMRVALTRESKVSLVASPWACVCKGGDRLANVLVGVTPADVPAGHYFFAQTCGVACVRAFREFKEGFQGETVVVNALSPGVAFFGDEVTPVLLSID